MFGRLLLKSYLCIVIKKRNHLEVMEAIKKTSVSVKVENHNKPATSKQLFALWRASRANNCEHDYRKDNLTMLQASELLQKFNANNTLYKPQIGVNRRSITETKKMAVRANKPSLREEFISYIKECMPKIVEAAKEAMQIKSVVQNDTKFVKDDGKRYFFMGFGCAFVWIEYDKRNKKAKEIYELSRSEHLSFTKDFESYFDKETLNYYQKLGFPIGALFQQDEGVQNAYYYFVSEFMKQKGCKKAYVMSRLD